MFLKKKKIIISVFLLIFIISWAYYFFFYKKKDSNASVSPEVFYDVSTWSLTSSIKVLWETNLLNEQKLKFNLVWTVKTIYVWEWDIVKSWDILAELDKWELNNELKEAYIKLENSKLNLDKALSKFSYEDKIKSEIDIENKKRKLEVLKYDINNTNITESEKIFLQEENIKKLSLELEKQKNNLDIEKSKIKSDFSNLEKDYKFKLSNLENDKWKLEKAIIDEKKSLEEKINSYNRTLSNVKDQIYNDISEFDTTLRNINEILLIDKDYNSNVSKNIYFSAKNTKYINQAEINYWEFKWAREKLLKTYKSISNFEDINNLIILLNIEKDLYGILYNLWDNISSWAINSIPTTDFTQSNINSISSTWNSTRVSWTNWKNTILDTIEKIKNLDSIDSLKQKSSIELNRINKEISDLEPNLEKLKLEYESYNVSLPSKIKELEFAYNTSKTNYDKAVRDLEELKYKLSLNWKDRENEVKLSELDYEVWFAEYEKRYKSKTLPEEIILLQNEVKQSEINIDNVNKKIENYEIKAPFDWIIDSLNLKIWDNLTTNSTEEKFINLVNPNIIEIKIKLDQIDIVKVKKWMSTKVTFDSYPENIFSWSLSFIDSKPTDDNWVKKYLAKILINKWDLNIFSWMSSNVEIVFDEIEDSILVPSMSIELNPETWENYVTLLKKWKKEKRVVELWIANDSMTQITSWLKIWDKILEINFDSNNFNVEEFKWPGYY